ncbi:hypothetical protein RvY_12333 [Ramazzottius varieornatus]|uniref:Uncharacterized protein n=1 Tax=Ramazzottius varieornatus TaxID=947166 RepID=A0A1D1VJ47_RAMVA|nr:hypothetical protein RvY_12333 [Ramazzottius varieornatus]
MDEYCIVPKRILDAQKQEMPASHPAEARDVKTVTGLIRSICNRPDINEWERNDMLSATLERYMALTNEHQESGRAISVPPQAAPICALPSTPEVDSTPQFTASTALTEKIFLREKRKGEMEGESKRQHHDQEEEPTAQRIPSVTSVATAPLARRQERKAEEESSNKRLNQGPDVEVSPQRVPTVTSVATVSLVRRSKRKTDAVEEAKRRHQELQDETADGFFVTESEPVANPAETPQQGQKRKPVYPIDKRHHNKKRASTLKRSSTEFRLPKPKRTKPQAGGLKSRRIVLR